MINPKDKVTFKPNMICLHTWKKTYILLVSHIALYCIAICSIAIQDMANLFKFIPFTTSSIPIGFINPLQVPPKELYSKTPNTLALLCQLFASCKNLQISSYSNSINRENKILTEKACIFLDFLLWKLLIHNPINPQSTNPDCSRISKNRAIPPQSSWLRDECDRSEIDAILARSTNPRAIRRKPGDFGAICNQT